MKTKRLDPEFNIVTYFEEEVMLSSELART